jgi:hypothetical protein
MVDFGEHPARQHAGGCPSAVRRADAGQHWEVTPTTSPGTDRATRGRGAGRPASHLR